jgi:hypothetical protein
MSLNIENHCALLTKSYNFVAKKTWENSDFIESEVEKSRFFFTDESLILGQPSTKDLEVYALLSGLPFSEKITEKLLSVQLKITKVLGDSLHYWVKPNNFGLEYFVFKWPSDDLNGLDIDITKQALRRIDVDPYIFIIRGIQVNPDGCIVARGCDENGSLFRVREKLKEEFRFAPKKQSEWAHIPIGRILEPIGEKKFIELKNLIDELSSSFVVSDTIDTFKFVHEEQWYMEKRSVIEEYSFT